MAASLRGSHESMQARGRSLDEPIHLVTRVGAIVRATVYGNDYWGGINGVGEVTLERLINQYKDDESGLIQYLTNTYPSFKENYKWLDGIYRNAPVFEMTNNATTSDVDFSFTGKILTCSVSTCFVKWQKSIRLGTDTLCRIICHHVLIRFNVFVYL